MCKQVVFSFFIISLIAVVFQNCDNGLILQDGLGSLESSQVGSAFGQNFQFSTGIIDGPYFLPDEERGDSSLGAGRSGFQFKNKEWVLDWSDEFNGPAGAKVRKPWHYAMRPNSGHRHRQGILTEQDAFLDGESHLKMRTVMRNGKPNHSFLRSSNFDGGDQMLEGPPNNLLLDPTRGPLYLETAVRFDKAYQSEDAWWAFWLFSPDTWDNDNNRLWTSFSNNTPRMEPYDGNAQTGMEVDIFEYVPYLGNSPYESRNGFNMAAFTSVKPSVALHLDTPNKGFVAEINKYLYRQGRAPKSLIRLTDGQYHRIGMYWDLERYEFYIDGHKIWEITDRNFITRTRTNAIILSWEVENGLWGDKIEKTFQSNDREVYVLIDYVRVFRAL